MSGYESKIEAPPPRPLLVALATIILRAIATCVGLVALTYLWHLLALDSDLQRATEATNLAPNTFVKLGFYERDLVPVIAGAVLLILFARLIPRLSRGSTSARTSSVVVALVLGVGCFSVDRIWGATTTINSTLGVKAAATIGFGRYALPLHVESLEVEKANDLPLAICQRAGEHLGLG